MGKGGWWGFELINYVWGNNWGSKKINRKLGYFLGFKGFLVEYFKRRVFYWFILFLMYLEM